METDDTTSRLPGSSTGYKTMVIGFGIFIALAMLYVVWVQWHKAATQLERPADGFVNYLNRRGVTAKKAELVDNPTALPAEQTFRIDVGDRSLWLFTFNAADKPQAQTLSALLNGDSVQLDGKKRPAKVHGRLVLVGYDGMPDEDKILKAFVEFDKQ